MYTKEHSYGYWDRASTGLWTTVNITVKPFFPSHGIQSHDRTHYMAITLCHKLFTFNRSVFHKQESIPFIIKPYFIDFKIYYLDSKLEMTITCTRSTNWSFPVSGLSISCCKLISLRFEKSLTSVIGKPSIIIDV